MIRRASRSKMFPGSLITRAFSYGKKMVAIQGFSAADPRDGVPWRAPTLRRWREPGVVAHGKTEAP